MGLRNWIKEQYLLISVDFKEGKMVYRVSLLSLPRTAGQRERKWLSPSTCQITAANYPSKGQGRQRQYVHKSRVKWQDCSQNSERRIK